MRHLTLTASLATVAAFIAFVAASTVSHAQVPLNYHAKQYYQYNPTAWLALQQQLLQRFEGSTHQNEEYRERPREVIPGTWTRIATPPVPLANPRLLTDGRVMAHNSSFTAPSTCGHPDWYVLTPDINGSYVNGTWTQGASLPTGYQPRFFGSGVLPDGRLIAVGGEYNGTCGPNQDTNLGAIYDPVANSWTSVAPPTTPVPVAIIGDATGIVLPNGIYMQTDCCANSSSSPKTPLAWTLNPSTLAWTQTGASKFDWYDEENIALLQNGLLLTVDAYVRVPPNFTNVSCGQGAELYNLRTVTGTITGTWSATGNVVDQQSDCLGVNASFEVGPLVVRPDGTAVSFSGVTQQATTTPVYADVYNPTAGTWSQLAQIPCVNTATQLQTACGAGTVYYTLADAPAAVLPNGNILFAASPGHWPASNSFPQPVHYFELECAFSDQDQDHHHDDDRSDRPRGSCTSTPNVTQVPDRGNSAALSSFQENLLVLPTGQVIAFSTDNSEVDIYTPKGPSYHPSWQPVVHNHPACVIPGDTYRLAGRQFNGLTEAGYYGDDVQASTNYPIVRIVNDRSGHVFYARTFNHSSRSIAPNTPVATKFQVSASTETGDSTLYVVANGIPSAGRHIHVSHTCPVEVAKENP